MKNGFLKGIFLGIGICAVALFGYLMGSALLRGGTIPDDEFVRIGTPSPTPTPVPTLKTKNSSENGEAEESNSTTETNTPKATVTLTLTPTPTSAPIVETEYLTERFLQKMNLIEDLVERNYYKQVSIEDLQSSTFKGIVEGLNDPYSEYLTPEEYQAMTQSVSGTYGGVGSYISMPQDSKNSIFLNPFENSPAKNAGIESGDVICEVDGENVLGKTTEEVVSRVRGEVGTIVHIKIYRPSIDKYLEFDVERAIISSPTVSTEILEGNVGYVYVSSFAAVTEEQFKNAMDELIEAGVVGFVIDLRDNPGGLLDVCVNMADYIVSESLWITYLEYRNGQRIDYIAHDNHDVDMPIVVLVNGNSASASEVFTGALKDNHYGTVMGTQTFGKGIVQGTYSLTDGSAVKLTTAVYYTPEGFSLHGVGIVPDVIVEYTEKDNQKEAARKYVLEQVELEKEYKQ